MLIQRLLHILFILLACSIIDSQCQKNYLVDRHVSNAVFPIQQPFRIPKTLKPLDYWIRIQPYFPLTDVEGEKRKDPPGGGANMTFEGQTTFLFEVVKETKELILHSVKLNYKKILLMNIKGEQLEDLTSLEELEAKRERVTVKPISTTLSVGSKYVLYFEYSGKINRYTEGGIYYTSYMEGKTQHWMIATHMEPGYARSVFPCLDEPDYKAIFHITLIYPRKEGYIALANMLERPAVRYDDHFDIIQFPPSPKMSSYLVAFTVGPLVNQQRINEAGTLVRIWGWTGQEHYLDFSADTAAKCLYQLGVYLDYTFPLKKSDQVGLPEFVAGAMENYGLIIYKYEYISFFDKLGSTLVRQAAARVICHELAHQWFGDTVTAMFWDDIFLNEGFAAYFENFGQQLALPIQRDMQIWKFLVESEQQGLVSDADLNYPTHPIYNASGSAFDDITYLKGASVLRMTRFTLGDDVFQNALKKYIKKYEFSNANHEMLYDIFTEAASEGNIKDWCGRPLNVTKFLDPWMLQKGFPLVTVTNNQLMGDAVYTQEPFIMQQLDKNPYEYKWPIPFFVKDYKTGKDNLNWIIPDYYKCKRSAESNAVHWYKGNAKLRSFVRVQYDDIGYTRLIKQLKEKPEDFETEDQIALIGDQIALLKRKRDAGLPFSFNKVLTVLTTILPRNIHFAVFEISAPIIDEIEIYFQGSEDFELFEVVLRLIYMFIWKAFASVRSSCRAPLTL
ncbi:hypothetical protein AB6A40_003331 [Gnathostoma spinigerum]|uniref:Aminopeptidase n=1 Tax=Gnathostoma spinigerum TaxID=75299 RepID=A0ABD6EIX9_9BILA